MPRGDKSKYTDKQKRKAEHIAEGYEERGVSEKTAEARAWATVNKEDGGGKLSGSGRGKKRDPSPSKKGSRKGGAATAKKSAKKKSAKKSAAKKTTKKKSKKSTKKKAAKKKGAKKSANKKAAKRSTRKKSSRKKKSS